VDLLVSMASVAANSSRAQMILEPYPLVFDPENPKVKALDPEHKNFATVIEILDKMPSVEMMTQAQDFVSMKDTMDKAHRMCFPLLQWIITSNRSHIVQLQTGKYIKSMVTPHQYLLLSAPPEKEEKFNQSKKLHGSIFAFHGSSTENWHSILRKGLVNASGTKLQVNGAAHGAGIYLSPAAATSFGYSRMNARNYNAAQKLTKSGGNRFLDSKNVNCIAICEVVDKDIRKSGDIWVQPHESFVVTRFFCVYTSLDPGTAGICRTDNPQFRDELLQVINENSVR